jgi:hypothetical protein
MGATKNQKYEHKLGRVKHVICIEMCHNLCVYYCSLKSMPLETDVFDIILFYIQNDNSRFNLKKTAQFCFMSATKMWQ